DPVAMLRGVVAPLPGAQARPHARSLSRPPGGRPERGGAALRPDGYCPRVAGSTPANVRKSTIRKSPVTRPLRVGSVGRQRGLAAEDLADDATADRPQVQTLLHDGSLAHDVIP